MRDYIPAILTILIILFVIAYIVGSAYIAVSVLNEVGFMFISLILGCLIIPRAIISLLRRFEN